MTFWPLLLSGQSKWITIEEEWWKNHNAIQKVFFELHSVVVGYFAWSFCAMCVNCVRTHETRNWWKWKRVRKWFSTCIFVLLFLQFQRIHVRIYVLTCPHTCVCARAIAPPTNRLMIVWQNCCSIFLWLDFWGQHT